MTAGRQLGNSGTVASRYYRSEVSLSNLGAATKSLIYHYPCPDLKVTVIDTFFPRLLGTRVPIEK